ncbi:MAG: G8 domain-containing protein [Pseudomonadota bacterium]
MNHYGVKVVFIMLFSVAMLSACKDSEDGVSGANNLLENSDIEGQSNLSLETNTTILNTNSEVTTAVVDGPWGAVTTWSNGYPNPEKRAIIPQGRNVFITTGQVKAKGVVVQGTLEIREIAGAEPSMTTDWIHINSNGIFRIGREDRPYQTANFTLNLIGVDPLADWEIETAMGMMPITDNNGFLMVAGGGSLQFFGKNKLTFTRLSSTAEAGSDAIFVRNLMERNFDGDYSVESDGELNWEVGDQIVIASSSYNYAEQEIRTITAIEDLGNTNSKITLDSPLSHRHYGRRETYGSGNNTRTIDMRAEVAVLNRNIKIQGVATQDTDDEFGDRARFNVGLSQGVGGHVMVMDTAGRVILDSVQLHGMGQSGRLGRYPMHWHIAGDRSGDVLRGVSITNSNNRGVTIHGTHNLLIENVVLHDIHGHGFFMEDAVETGNRFIANIAFGIHKVGRSELVGDNAPDLNDPFIVDTHDHVAQNPLRFLSSAAYWMTNPDNTWRGNVSAGSEGTGFWFLFPSFPIGEAANDPQYDNVVPEKVNLKEFFRNTAHSSPIGFTVERSSDIEVPVGAQLKSNFDGDRYNPTVEPQFSHFTGYKTQVAVYHRGDVGNFVNNRFADNFNSTFITFTQRITNALYVGHSRGNSDPNQIVTGHSFYDGPNILDGSHFAGFSLENAHMLRTHTIASRNTHFVMRNSSYEDDGSADHMSFSNRSGGSFFVPISKGAPSVIYDEDGTLTSHVGGGPGYTIIPDHPYYYDSDDFLPPGWHNARVSADHYALMRMINASGSNTTFRVTTPDGDVASDKPGVGQFSGTNALVKVNDGEYRVNFPDGIQSVAAGFDVAFVIRRGPNTGSAIVQFRGIGNSLTVTSRGRSVNTMNALRNATETSFFRQGNHLFVKFFPVDAGFKRVTFRPMN